MRRRFLLVVLFGSIFFAGLSAPEQLTARTGDFRAASTSFAMDRPAQEVAKAQLVSINGFNCPVLASAERGAPGAVVRVRKGDADPSTMLHLHFATADNKQITNAEVTLHGDNGRARTELAATGSNGNVTEKFHLTAAPHEMDDTTVAPVLVVNDRWVSVTEITFADGSVWHQSKSSYCSIQPNGFRRINLSADQ